MLLVVGIVCSVLQNRSRNAGSIGIIDQVLRGVCSPVAALSSKSVLGVQGFFYGALNSSHLREKNDKLKRELENLSMYSETISTYQREVDNLRTELNLDKTYKREKVVGDITGYFPQQHRISVSLGRNKGIKEGMPAVCAQGLVGKVQVVGTTDCQVLLLTSSSMQLGAIAEKYNPPAAGLVYGENAPTLLMKFLSPEVPVSSGDIIFTSGFSPQIPKGIVIGRVLSAESLPEFGSSRARIFPAVNVGELREIVILK